MLDLLYLCDKSRRFTASRHNQSGKPIASMLDLLYLCDKSRRFTASRHNQLGKPIASALDLLYLCKIMCGGGYEVIDRRNN